MKSKTHTIEQNHALLVSIFRIELLKLGIRLMFIEEIYFSIKFLIRLRIANMFRRTTSYVIYICIQNIVASITRNVHIKRLHDETQRFMTNITIFL